ncbi:MAG: CPBP family intramembrane metalloprotease [Leptospirales bacterium]|nr:CPBP family intramembrane metalloprotease [Leptospirales bacterium]
MKSDLSSGFLWCAAFLGVTALVSWILPAGLWFVGIPVFAATILTSFFYYVMRRKVPWQLELPPGRTSAAETDFRSILVIPAVGAGIFALGQVSPQAPWPMRDGIDLIAAFISMVVLGPVSEEIFFRGLLLNEMRRTNISIWAGTALFAVSHLNPAVFLFAFASGLVLAHVASWTGSLGPSIAIHSISNLLTVLTWAGWILAPGMIVIAGLVLAGGCALVVLRRV